MRAAAPLAALLLLAAGAARAQEVRPLVQQALDAIEAWDPEAAARVLDDLVAQHPRAPETAWIRGKVLFEQGRYDEAVHAFEEAKKLSGGTGPALEEDARLARAVAEEVRGAQPLESAHFSVRAKASKDRVLVPWALDGLEAAWAALTQDLGYQPPGRIRVEIYDTPQALARVSTLTVAEIKASGTIALCKYNRLMITSPRALLRGYPWQDTLAHEFVHFLVTKKGKNAVPIWLHEGLAKFLETRWRGAPGLAVDELSQHLLETAAKKNELIPFAAMHPSIAKLPTQEKAALAFAEVESAIRLLYQRGGQGALTELVAAMAGGFSDQQAVAQAYGKGFSQFEAEWRAEVGKPRKKAAQAAKGPRAMPQRPLVFKEDVKGKKEDGPVPKDPAARRAVRLGEILFARGRWKAAAVEYGRARQLLPEEDPVVARRYAFAQLQSDRVPEAKAALLKAVERDPADPSAQTLLGEVLLRLGELAGAKAALVAAVGIDPFDPRVHAGLLAVARGQKDKALEQRAQEALALLSGREQHGAEKAGAVKEGTP